MTTALNALSRVPVLQDLEALYQSIYGTPERKRKTDRVLLAVIASSTTIIMLQSLAYHAMCGAGAL